MANKWERVAPRTAMVIDRQDSEKTPIVIGFAKKTDSRKTQESVAVAQDKAEAFMSLMIKSREKQLLTTGGILRKYFPDNVSGEFVELDQNHLVVMETANENGGVRFTWVKDTGSKRPETTFVMSDETADKLIAQMQKCITDKEVTLRETLDDVLDGE